MRWLVPLLVVLGCGSSPTGSSPAAETPSSESPAAATRPCNGAPGSYRPVAAGSAPAAVRSAAETGLPSFLAAVGDTWAAFGFESREELGAAELGVPYAVSSFSSLSDTGISGAATPAMWRFPVVANGAFRSVLDVAYFQDRWQAVSIGAAGVAASLQVAETRYPKLASGSRSLVEVFGSCCSPYVFLGIDLEQATPSFVPMYPATELVTRLPQYAAWTAADPVPVLSWEELSAITQTLSCPTPAE